MVLAEGAASEIEWVQQWRDLGYAVWLVAAVALAGWLALFALAAARARPRRVRPGADEVGPPGDEPPALVNLLTGPWVLGREAMAATALDLAARGHLSLYGAADEVTVSVPDEGRAARVEDDVPLHPCEQMVLAHVRDLATRSDAGTVPARALTTGTRKEASAWWHRFRREVHRDAIDRGLACRRWSWRLRLLVILPGLVPALAFAFASATQVVAPNEGDDSLAAAGAFYGLVAFIGLCVLVVVASRGVADTADGRHRAARWLAWRRVLSDDVQMADYGPADVGVWGRRLAYGAAMGLAPGAVGGVPLGAEDVREVWSTTGGRWRRLRVRIPRWGFRCGYGWHPAMLLCVGGMLVGAGGVMIWALDVAAVGDVATYGELWLVSLLWPVVFGVWWLLRGVVDLVLGRHLVEGQVVRITKESEIGSRWARWSAALGNTAYWYVVVDDGHADRVRAWRVSSEPGCAVGARVRAQVTRRQAHVRRLEVLSRGEAAVGTADEASAQPPVFNDVR